MQFCKSQVMQPNRSIWFALTRPREKTKMVPVRNLCRLEYAPFPTSSPRELSTGRALATTSRCGHCSEDGHGVACCCVVVGASLPDFAVQPRPTDAVGLGSVGRLSGAESTAFGGIDEPGAGAQGVNGPVFRAAVHKNEESELI